MCIYNTCLYIYINICANTYSYTEQKCVYTHDSCTLYSLARLHSKQHNAGFTKQNFRDYAVFDVSCVSLVVPDLLLSSFGVLRQGNDVCHATTTTFDYCL